ncbi:DUF2062 domain-containing protein [Novosphingobium mangrovi (ex Huang et al. 2023)]|uniref:DUF2062 domain-containing protein n=1 Tax=Novosphingobium mangrovi (ex Huang et al. 2023) TaxID=2976432 RepID=A0ABT2I7C3_9SPHN|nr:DUF2062 domain-containing protein [Novosphingobium mangrovi (ex Huang et al. 2023)]MCT2400715.1 DUF2062 domain-containing protein [Novosphingobium mangrovi (ex Huang et al. 2023)]
MNTFLSRMGRWLHRQMPTHEQLEANRLTAPFARRQELFRFTRRSVPRGVAVGLLVGIFALIPGVQIVGAALMCVPCRGNIPLAAAMTFLSNPATTPLILAGSIWIGNLLGFHADLTTFYALYERGAGVGDWTHWLVSDAAPALLVGLFVISTVAAAVGYLLSMWFWRFWIGRKHVARRTRWNARVDAVVPDTVGSDTTA